MEIINKIKTLLKKCNNEEIEIYDYRIVNYFSSILHNNGFSKIVYDYFMFGIYLDSVAINPTLFIEYDINAREDKYEFLLFNDKDMKYNYEPIPFSINYELTYDLFNENIWNLIYNILNEWVNNHHNNIQLSKTKLRLSEESILYCEELQKQLMK